MREQKQQLRQKTLQRLKAAASADAQQLRSARLRDRLAEYLQSAAPLCVAIYAPLAHEVNLMPLLDAYPQHRFVFPRCLREHRMAFHVVRNPERDMHPGAMGIPAPAAHTPEVEPSEIDLLIVPGVAFTREGKRLGYGGGYYDRFIPLCSRARVIAVAFDEQIVPAIPTESHDLIIPGIITAGVT